MDVLNAYMVYVDSRRRVSGSDANFTYNIAFPPDHNFDRVTCLNALIPKSYYLIQAGYNTFQLKEISTTVTISIPLGCYMLTAWESTIGNLLTTNSPNGWIYSVTYPSSSAADTGKLTYAVTGNAGSQPSLIFDSVLFEPFGFSASSTNVFSSDSLTSTTVIKLQSEDRLLIRSNMVNNPNVDDVLVSINAATNVNYSSINYINFYPEFNAKVLSSKSNNTYSFSLTNESGIVLDLNGLNLNLTLVFYKKDDVFQKIKDFMKMIVLK